ncbi:MAG: B12-binding domain-containing radical SAM protein, partial [Massilimaliae sp.]|nr:B12-binding domain-containing radical SAM protein [Massiliimalia sp.]
MKTLLVGINAKYIHSNLAIRYLRDYAAERGETGILLQEFTINQRIEQILPEIYRTAPELIGFSCYIWNFSMVKRLVSELKKVLPNCLVLLGGPEVSYNAEEALRETPADFIICGEGEEAFFRLLDALRNGADLQTVSGLAYRAGTEIRVTSPAPLLSMDDLPFVYRSMDDLEHKIIYFESSRGCPFSCQYCLSCNDRR